MLFLALFSIYIFTLIGMETFPFIKQGKEGLNRYNNFTGFLKGAQALYKVLTSENWDALVESLEQKLEPNNICFDYTFKFSNYEKFGAVQCGDTKGFIF